MCLALGSKGEEVGEEKEVKKGMSSGWQSDQTLRGESGLNSTLAEGRVALALDSVLRSDRMLITGSNW